MFNRFQLRNYLVAQDCDLCISHTLIVQKLGRAILCEEAHIIIEQIILDKGADREDVFSRTKAVEQTVGFRTTGKVE